MSDQPRGNTITEIVRVVLGGMPPGLVILGVLFGGLVWYLDNENAHRAKGVELRTEAVAKLLEKCVEERPK